MEITTPEHGNKSTRAAKKLSALSIMLISARADISQSKGLRRIVATKRPESAVEGDTSPNFYQKLNKALRLENDELHHKVDDLRKINEQLQRQIKQLTITGDLEKNTFCGTRDLPIPGIDNTGQKAQDLRRLKQARISQSKGLRRIVATKRPESAVEGDTSPNFYQKLNKALRLENDELHYKVDELRRIIEHFSRQQENKHPISVDRHSTPVDTGKLEISYCGV
ncbi:hypothetical protein ABG067_000837 [Albugo candida]